MKILLLNGSNLDMLGVREPAVYGSQTLADLEAFVCAHAAERGVSVGAESISSFKLGKIAQARYATIL